MAPDHTSYASYLFIRPMLNIYLCTHAAKALTSAFGARTAFLVIPSTFYTPWLRIVGAPLSALVCFRRRRE